SFKATLEEVVEADLLLHVVDVSHAQAAEQIAAVEIVLKEIEAWGKPTVVALNKIDKLTDGATVLEKFQREFDHAVPISAKDRTNFDQLLDEIANRLADRRVDVTLSIPHDRAKTIALVYRSGYVTAREMENGNVVLRAHIPKVLAGELTPYVVKESKRK
ncbi:MAG: GTPase HflX, partial [Verrucomicrobiia bacterium]